MMPKTKWNRWVVSATSMLLIGVAYVALFAQSEEEDTPPTATLTAESITLEIKPTEPATTIRASGGVMIVESTKSATESKGANPSDAPSTGPRATIPARSDNAASGKQEPMGALPRRNALVPDAPISSTSPPRRPSALEVRSPSPYSSVRMTIPLATDRYPLEQIYEVVPPQTFAVVARRVDANGETSESFVAANCQFIHAETAVRKGPDRNLLIVNAPLPDSPYPLPIQSKIDDLSEEGYEFHLDGLALKQAKPEELRLRVRIPLAAEKYPPRLLQANIGNEDVCVVRHDDPVAINEISLARGCRLEAVEKTDSESEVDVVISYDKNAPRPGAYYLKQSDVDRDAADNIVYGLTGLFDPYQLKHPGSEDIFSTAEHSEEQPLESYRLIALPIDPAQHRRDPGSGDLAYDINIISETGEAIHFATDCLFHLQPEHVENEAKRMLIAVPQGRKYARNRKISQTLVETLSKLEREFRCHPHPAPDIAALQTPTNAIDFQPRSLDKNSSPTAAMNPRAIPAPGTSAGPTTAPKLQVQQDALTQASGPAVVRVPLDSNTFPEEWLNHNKWNHAITLFAEGTGITKESNGFYGFGRYFVIRKVLPESPAGGVNLVDLEVVGRIDPASQASEAVTNKTMQEKVDQLRAKKFRFLLQGLIPLGETVPSKATSGQYPNSAAWAAPSSIGQMPAYVPFAPPNMGGMGMQPQPTGVTAWPPNFMKGVSSNFSIPAPPTPNYQLPHATASAYPPAVPAFPALERPNVKLLVRPKAGLRQELETDRESRRYSLVLAETGRTLTDSCRVVDVSETERNGEKYLEVELGLRPIPMQNNEPLNVNDRTELLFNQAIADQHFAAKRQFQLFRIDADPAVPPQQIEFRPNAPHVATLPTNVSGLHFQPAPNGAVPNPPLNIGMVAPSSAAAPMYAPAMTLPAPTSAIRFGVTINPALEQKKLQAMTKLEKAKSDEEKESAREELRKALAEIFAADMKNRDKQAADIEARVKKLREQYDARENAKDEIIELQLKLLEKQTEGLEFPGNGPSR